MPGWGISNPSILYPPAWSALSAVGLGSRRSPGGPVSGSGEGRRKRRGGVPGSRIQLGLGEEEALLEPGASQVGPAKIGAQEVGLPKVRTTQIGSEQVGPAQAGTVQIFALELGANQVCAPAVRHAVTELRAHHLTDPLEQRADLLPVCRSVEPDELVGVSADETFGVLPHPLALVAQRTGGQQRESLGQVPQQLLELTHHREDREYRLRDLRGLSPVAPPEGHLDDLLTGAKAVEDSAAREALPSQVIVNAAAEVGTQLRAGPAGLSMAKSEDATKAGATQHSPAQRLQSARRLSRGSVGRDGAPTLSVTLLALLDHHRSLAASLCQE